MNAEAVVCAAADILDQQAEVLRAQAKALRVAASQHHAEPASPGRALSIETVCELLDCGETFVRDLIAKGDLTPVRLSGRAVRVEGASVTALIKRRAGQ